MEFTIARNLGVMFAAVALTVGPLGRVAAQPVAGTTSDSTGAAAQPNAASNAQLTRAEHKAARKEARAKKDTDLEKLESNGYDPSRNSLTYPQGLQNTQQKAADVQGASR